VVTRPESSPVFTKRELDVLWCVVKGWRDRETAAYLGITPGTVRTYLRTIREKLAVHSRLEAAVLVTNQGLLDGHAPTLPTHTHPEPETTNATE